MSEPKKHPGGRPKTGTRFPRQFTVYETDRGMELLQEIARKWETTNAEVIRRLIREEARRLGLIDGGAE